MKLYLKLFLFLYVFPLIVSASLLFPTSHHHKTCSNIESHSDQCAFVISSCQGFSGYFLKFYYCSTLWKPFVLFVMLSGLLLLFGAVSVVAADFFCPNLQTISSKLQLSESMAGVTVLAFGNGSPDLFSTFTAMNSGSGSLAIGELIGAAFFIVSVVSGCMGIIRPFQSKRITFMRDASFLTGAIMILTWIVYHKRICWYHGLLLIVYYLTYVITVVMGTYKFSETEIILPESKSIQAIQEILTETSGLLVSPKEEPFLKTPKLYIPPHEHLGHVIRPVSPNPSHLSRGSSFYSNYPDGGNQSAHGSISSRLYRHPLSPRIGIRTSLFGAIDFQEKISNIRRVSSAQHLTMPSRHSSFQRSSQLSVPCLLRSRTSADFINRSPENHSQPGDYFTFISTPLIQTEPDDPILIEKEPRQWMTEIIHVLLPSLKDWSLKTWFAKANAIIALPVVFILTLTLPVTEQVKVDDVEMIDEVVPEAVFNKSCLDYPEVIDQETKIGWCRWLLVVQAICSMTF
ncbi:hypothetical protein CU098_000652, partial [Rhizopus stolonifer]